jgi:flagellar biosynthesis protein FliR
LIKDLVEHSQLFLLVFFRIIAMVEVAPLLSSTAIPQVAKVGLSFFTASAVFPWVMKLGYPIPPGAVDWFILMLGEVLVGLLIGFLLLLVFSAFTMAGQFFSLQMGFGASEVYDPMAQVEVPLIGEYLNLVAMLVFLSSDTMGFQKFFLSGVASSFQHLRAVDLVLHKDDVIRILINGLAGLFQSSLTISFPILGTLLLISIGTGLMSKASPQMDVLSMGFPISIAVSFLLLFAAMPALMTAFSRIIDGGFESIGTLVIGLGGVK